MLAARETRPREYQFNDNLLGGDPAPFNDDGKGLISRVTAAVHGNAPHSRSKSRP
jgi:hypothetical protein